MRTTGPLASMAGLASVGLYLYKAAKFRRLSRREFELTRYPTVESAEFRALLETVSGTPVREANRIEVLRNGDRFFPAMLDAIKKAERSIDFATFVYWTGSIAPEIADALTERARKGVEVNVLLDAVGAAPMDPALCRKLEEAGATVAWFRPVRWFNIGRLNNRTHRKILVVDGRIGFTGGAGIAGEWEGDGGDPAHWRDTHFRIEGPVVRELFSGFQEEWAEVTGRILAGDRLLASSPHPSGIAAQVMRSSPAKGRTTAEQLFWIAIACARRRLWITNAYFAPRTAFVRALCRAARRGVDVRVLTNGPHTDARVVRHSGSGFYGELLESGVRLYEYQPTMIHAKVLTVDGMWSSVGSINFDDRSFALNDELNLSLWDAATTARLDADFETDLYDSKEVSLSEWRRRPLRRRLQEAGGAMVRAQI